MLDGARPTVVLTRRPEDNAPLAAILRARGLEVIALPCVRTEPLEDSGALAEVVAQLTPADVLVLTSRAGVDAVSRVAPRGRIACSVAVVGSATADRARAAGFDVLLVAPIPDSRVLGEQLPISRGRIVLARSDLADRDLPRILRQRGGDVHDVVAYRTVAGIDGDTGPVRAALERGAVTFVVGSPSAAAALVAAFDRHALRAAQYVTLGERTARAVRERLGVTATIAGSTDSGALARAVVSDSAVPA